MPISGGGDSGAYLAAAALSDAAYGAGWDGDTTHAPSKNAVYDKIETLGAGLTQEQVEDYVGNLLADSDTIDVTYNDAGGAESFAPKQIGCKAKRTASQTINHATVTALAFTAADVWDSSGLHDPATNPSRITVDRAGKWRFTANVYWDASFAFAVWFQHNGVSENESYSNVTGVGLAVTVDLTLSAGDYVEFFVYQDSGSSKTVNASVVPSTFSAHYLGA